MSKISKDKKLTYIPPENQLKPEVMGVCANLVVFPSVSSPTRLYMVGNMIPKSVVTNGASGRKLMTGFEYQYGKTARAIVAPSNMVVEEIFYVESLLQNKNEMTDRWSPIYIVFKNDEKNMYDILELPKYNAQNTYVGFEYQYDRKVMNKLVNDYKDAVFPKGTVFAKSPRVDETGEWRFGMDLKVVPGSFHFTEEDGIAITESCARDKLKCMFEHQRKFSWNEDDYIPLMLYGDKPFPESGERIRPDGIVMGFRRRVKENALVSLTKKALSIPDYSHDILLMAPPNSEVMQVEVVSERMKNRSNNRSVEHIEQTHNLMLDRYERKQNEMWNNVLRWYHRKLINNRDADILMTDALDNFIRKAYGNFTRNATTGKNNSLNRATKKVKLKDWNVTILLREQVEGRSKFKMAGMNGDKGVIVKIIPDHEAPRYADGTVGEIFVNNTPAFRRQIYSMLMEQSINFININVHKEVVADQKKGDYEAAFKKLFKFYETGFPEFAEIVKNTIITPEDIRELVDHTARTQISVQVRSDSPLYGVEIIRALRKVYNYQPQKIIFTDSLGEVVESINPVLITTQHFMLLDKFGTDMSAQSLPASNLFGMPAKLNETSKHGSFIKDSWNRNNGETESRLKVSQVGGKEQNKQLAMGYSPELRIMMTKRIYRAEDPFDINQIIKEEEYGYNRAVAMASGMLSDSCYILRHERPDDLTESSIEAIDFNPQTGEIFSEQVMESNQ